MHRRLPLLALFALLVGPSLATAQEPVPSEKNPLVGPIEEPPDILLDTSDGTTALPDEARGWETPPGMESEDAVLFLPRVVFWVPTLALEVAFLPLRGGLYLVDRYKLIPRVERFLYWNEQHTLGWTPVLFYSSQYGPSVGATVFHNSLLGHGEKLSVKARYGGRFVQGYGVSFEADRFKGSRLWLDTNFSYEKNPSMLFQGIGTPRSPVESAYSQTRWLGLMRIGHTFGPERRSWKVGAMAIFNHRTFGDPPDSVAEEPTSEAYDVSEIPGFEDGATTLEIGGSLVADHRRTTGLDSTGVYLEAFAGGVPAIDDFTYIHYGAEISYTIDLYRATRLLTFRGVLEAVQGDDDQIPFSELPRLGGAHRLRGYAEAQFRDEKAALASVEYLYPVHASILGSLFVDAGYVANEYSDLFDLQEWKLGYGGGLILGSSDAISFRFQVAYGDSLHIYLATDLAHAFRRRSEQL
ncbi:MAG: BamA/TamA family outer membrane protein [Deltaproteobacteria bacterium]|nr:BamA/TamA family outer membrane protein [Deltaproteobacteria bacterium]